SAREARPACAPTTRRALRSSRGPRSPRRGGGTGPRAARGRSPASCSSARRGCRPRGRGAPGAPPPGTARPAPPPPPRPAPPPRRPRGAPGRAGPPAPPLSRPPRGVRAPPAAPLAGAPTPAVSRDEIGDLAGAFNVLLGAIAERTRQNHAFMADLVHELKSPV